MPCGSVAVGVKLYAEPAVTAVAGVPRIVGGPSTDCAETVMLKAGSEALAVPSLTVITMFAKLPTFAAAGVPESRRTFIEVRPRRLILNREGERPPLRIACGGCETVRRADRSLRAQECR